MNKTKRFLAIMLSVCICFLSFQFAAATEAPNIQVSEGKYSISQEIDSFGRVVRKMERSESGKESRSILSRSEIVEMLELMGMDSHAVEKMSGEKLQKYATAPRMYSMVSYFKSDNNGTVTYITEEEMEKNVNATKDTRGSNTETDSYMTLSVFATDMDDGYAGFFFETEARWNVMPTFRGKDSIAVSAHDVSMTENTASGYYSYIETTISNGSLYSLRDHEDTKTDIPSSAFQLVSNDDFTGMGTVINLPNNTGLGSMTVVYSDYFVHMECYGHLRSPGPNFDWFNVVGSYSHTVITLSASPTLTIDGKGVAGSIGLAANITQERRNVFFEQYFEL